MLSPKRLVEKARKGITLKKTDAGANSSYACTTSIAEKGHFVVYTEDGARFMVPLTFLDNPIFQKLLKVSEEELGLPGDGPITLVCSAAFLECILSLLKRRMTKDLEVVLLASLGANRCAASLLSYPGFNRQGLVIS